MSFNCSTVAKLCVCITLHRSLPMTDFQNSDVQYFQQSHVLWIFGGDLTTEAENGELV